MVRSSMSKRVSVTVPDRTHELLEIWAEVEGTSLSDLASYILRRAVDEAEGQGKISLNSVKRAAKDTKLSKPEE